MYIHIKIYKENIYSIYNSIYIIVKNISLIYIIVKKTYNKFPLSSMDIMYPRTLVTMTSLADW